MKKNRGIIIVCILGALLFVPWLGEALFQTKGEPREAIVAVTMLQDGNWILPVSYGADIPYKPPLLAWLIAVFSAVLNGGAVNEFTSRLPSALAGIALLAAGWRLVASHSGNRRAWVMTLVCMTAFEFFRACNGCRVDMVLTCCMVGSMYAMFTMRGHPWRYLWAVLLMSGAVLAKGPVGALLPCLAMGIYFLLAGRNFWRVFFTLLGLCVASFILPALWYWAAWQQGGEEFLRLALEENVGRLTGTMSYGSHINPWYYNLEMILAGMLPWTVPVLIALCYRSVRTTVRSLKLNRGLPLMAWTAALTVLVFYCIPASKRGVYLLPCYPFLAYGAAWVLEQVDNKRLIRGWSVFLSIICLIAPVAMIVLSCLDIPKLPVATLSRWQWIIAMMPLCAGVWWLASRRISRTGLRSALAFTFLLLLTFNAAYAPAFLNPRSDLHTVAIIEERVPADAKIVSYIEQDRLIRYYSMNFYMNDRLRRVTSPDSVPPGAWLLTDKAVEGTRGDTISRRSADTGRPIILVPPVGHSEMGVVK